MSLEMFPRRGHWVHDIFDTSRDSGKQWTQLLKAQAAEDICEELCLTNNRMSDFT